MCCASISLLWNRSYGGKTARGTGPLTGGRGEPHRPSASGFRVSEDLVVALLVDFVVGQDPAGAGGAYARHGLIGIGVIALLFVCGGDILAAGVGKDFLGLVHPVAAVAMHREQDAA